MLHIGRRFLLRATGIAFDGAKSVLRIATAARYPLFIESYSIGNGSNLTSAQVETVWSLATGGAEGGAPTTLTAVDLDGGGTTTQFVAKTGVTGVTFDDTKNQQQKGWPSAYGIEFAPPSPRSWLWLPAGAGPNTWHLRLLNTPTNTFNADVEVVIQEVAA